MNDEDENVRNLLHKKLIKEYGKNFTPELTEKILPYLFDQQLVYDDKEHKRYIFNCPHCLGTIDVMYRQVACKIFRHAHYFKHVGKRRIIGNLIGPHTKKSRM
jgi:hypothetical protein